jgi:hypothetical protein
MKNLIVKLLITIYLFGLFSSSAFAETKPKVIVLDFQLNDLTDLPNAPEELARIAYLSATYKQQLLTMGVEVLPANDKLDSYLTTQSATYLFDNVEHAAILAAGSGADYLLIGVALKPTYLFVYPRILLIDIKTQKVVMAKAAQLESSWSDKNTTARTAEKLANIVSDALNKIQAQNTISQ